MAVSRTSAARSCRARAASAARTTGSVTNCSRAICTAARRAVSSASQPGAFDQQVADHVAGVEAFDQRPRGRVEHAGVDVVAQAGHQQVVHAAAGREPLGEHAHGRPADRRRPARRGSARSARRAAARRRRGRAAPGRPPPTTSASRSVRTRSTSASRRSSSSETRSIVCTAARRTDGLPSRRARSSSRSPHGRPGAEAVAQRADGGQPHGRVAVAAGPLDQHVADHAASVPKRSPSASTAASRTPA